MASYPTGYLSYGNLPGFVRERVCPRCKGDPRPRQWNELCQACAESDEVQAAFRRRKAKENRAYLKRKRTGTVMKSGRPRKDSV